MLGPLGNYGIAKSLVQTPGWKPLEAAEGGMMPQGGRSGGGFSLRGGGGSQYRGRIGADTTNLPPSQRGLYENSAPSLEAIQGAYDANLENGMTHDEIMTLFNDQADRDKAWWAKGFANDPNFSQTLYDNSQAMMKSKYGTTAASGKAHNKSMLKGYASLYEYNKNQDRLIANAGSGAFTTPTLGPTAGGWSAPTVKAAASTVWGGSPGASNMGTTASTWKPSWTGGF